MLSDTYLGQLSNVQQQSYYQAFYAVVKSFNLGALLYDTCFNLTIEKEQDEENETVVLKIECALVLFNDIKQIHDFPGQNI